jgi:CheY-like chemotaxis protein/signal transduction histidine kinase
MRLFWSLLLSCMPLLALAVDFDEYSNELSLDSRVTVLEDVRGDLQIAQLASPEFAGKFLALEQSVLNVGFSQSAYWLRLDLSYRSAQAAPHAWLLEVAFPPLDQVDLYLPNGRGGYRLAQHTGDSQPFASRQLAQNNYVFPLSLAPNQRQQVYLRVQSQGSIIVPLTLWSPTAYLPHMLPRIYLLGLIYGLLLVMLLYNLFIFLSVRERSYLYYIAYVGAAGLYQVSVNGTGIEYFWPNSPWLANALTPFAVSLAVICACQFARSFLHTAKQAPKLDLALLGLMLLGALVSLLALFVSYTLASRLSTLLVPLLSVALLLGGVRAWQRGLHEARYFVLAWCVFLLGSIVTAAMLSGLLAYSVIAMYASHIGSALAVGLLSLALADRINAMKAERAKLQQQSARELQVLNQQLEVSSQRKDEFLATLSHELRTPMNGVNGALELMKTLPQDVAMQQYQQLAVSASRDMMRMVNDVLLLTELQAGKLHACRAMFSVRSWLESLRVRYVTLVSEQGLQWCLEFDEKIPDSLEGDADKLSRCVSYLMDTVLAFNCAGNLILRVKRGAVRHATLGLQVELQYTLACTAQANAAPLYPNAQRLEHAGDSGADGLGVSMAICRQLLAMLGGSLSHRRLPEQGGCFLLNLELGLLAPLPLPLNVMSTSTSTLRTPRLQTREPMQCRVLLVEDNAINQLVLRGMLLKLGYQVCCADNGRAALELLSRESVDMVLLDCQMPELDGFATCRALRMLPGCSELPVLALTAHSHAGDRERCLAAGMNDYLSKPLRFATLQTLLHDWLLCQEGR